MLLVATLAASLGACGKADMFSAHPDMVAKAAGQELSAERVAEILTSVKGISLDPVAANFVANLWVDYTLLAQKIVAGEAMTDSAFIREAMWTEVASYQAGQFFDSLMAARDPLAAGKLDSAITASGMINIQHILVGVEQDASEAQRVAARRKIDGILARARGGADFAELARANSEDPGSAENGGYYGPVPRGQFVPAFDSASFALEPGAISDVVPTQFGFHIIRRLTEEESRPRFEEAFQGPLVNAMEEGYYQELRDSKKLKVASSAVPLAKEALLDLDANINSTKKLVTYSGGTITVADFVRWIRAQTNDPVQGPQLLQQMQQTPDSNMQLGLQQMGERFLFLKEAEAAGMDLTPEQWTEVREMFVSTIDSIRADLQLTDEAIDPNASEADRRAAAAMKVDQFFDRMVTGQSRLRLLPGMLSWSLRSNGEYGVNPAGAARAIEIAQVKQAAEGGGAGAAGAPGGAIQPAPGGPPVGNGTP
jgi:hypothetical protein